jgi:DNA-binding MarR family transcriptional regulator
MILLMREDNFTSTPSLLAEKAGVSRATMTRLIDGLERDALVSRQFDSEDRRSFSVTLTRAGQKKLDALIPDYYRRVKASMQALGKERFAELDDLLDRVQEGIKAFD